MPSVLHRLARWAEADPQSAAHCFKRNGRWENISAQEVCDRVYALALFLESRGLTRESATCILSPNCPEWVHMDLASLLVGARSAGLYPNSTSKDIAYVLGHTDAVVLGVRNKEYFSKLGDADLSLIKTIIVFDGDTSVSPKAVAYEAAVAEGRRLAAQKGATTLKQYLDRLDVDRGAFMIYTSGTTGNPKGALLSHDNMVYTTDLVVKHWRLPMARGSLFSFLPLCHVAERLQNVGVGISQRYKVTFCTAFDNVAVELPEAQPTLLLCVPRLWEKMMEGVQHKVANGKGAKKKMAEWALAVGARVAKARFSGGTVNPLDLIQLRLADKLVLSKIRAALGLAKAETLASGAAALPSHVSWWFRSIGLEILEDFGQTESTGVICMTEPGVESAGTVGKPVHGLEVKIAEDGELLTRGRHVFKGYYKDEASTAATLEGGWLHTGDLGEVNERGLIRIRGRKKEILKTSGGKMIAPVPIEEALKAAPLISQVCMVGDGRKYLSVLVTLSEGKMAELKTQGAVGNDRTITRSDVVAEVGQYIAELNGKLANYEQIKRFVVLSAEFSIIEGEMTPTLKMKRNVIESRYRDLIEQMYG